jgi:predicted GIY-YIG superfamily endonuclease
MSTCNWPLGNGQELECNIYDTNTTWHSVAGLYIFAYRTDQTYWRALYVGQTDDFSSRIPSHERWNEAVRLEATHIHALVVPQAATRDKLEKMLIQTLQPPMNVQDR